MTGALVDGHVHLHDCFEASAFLDAAAANFTGAAKRLGISAETSGFLLLTESQGVDRFAGLADGAASAGAWRVDTTPEPVSLIARQPGRPPIVLVAGRQIVTREGLEVLALGTRATFTDGDTLDATLAQTAAKDAVPVLPWGVGKWLGARGRLVTGLLDRGQARPLFLGDNGGRLGIGPRPKLFARADNRHVPVLPGSDPLPWPEQLAKVGGYGFVAETALDEQAPFAALRGYLEALEASPRSFGRMESLPGFIRSQVAMQLQKRYRPRAQ